MPAITQLILLDEKILVMPYKRPMTQKGFLKKQDYLYDQQNDCYRCPGSQILKYRTINQGGYREYKSDQKRCVNCPQLKQCTESKAHQKTITGHVWADAMDEIYFLYLHSFVI